MEKFWMVWKAEGSPPARMHETLSSAEQEAERLALANHGNRFVVLESIKFCTFYNPINWYDTDDIVF